MAKIDPSRLKRLRTTKGWSQEELAEKTKAPGQPKIDKQTISRLERGIAGKTRGRTIEQLARALGVEPAVLAGEAPLPETKFDPFTPKYQFNVRISRAARNAMILVAQRYPFVEPWQIVELAPFLFLWAAETSLRHRQDRVTRVEAALQTLRDVESEVWDGPPVPHDALEEEIEAERGSIALNDIWRDSGLGSGSGDPFSEFLRNLVKDFGDIAEFEEWSEEDGTPSYSVCMDAAVELAGGNRDLANIILRGDAALNEMPKEICPTEKVKERTEWVIASARKYLEARKEELEASLKMNKEAST